MDMEGLYVVRARGVKAFLYLELRRAQFPKKGWDSAWVQAAPDFASHFPSEAKAWTGLRLAGCGGPAGYEVVPLAEAIAGEAEGFLKKRFTKIASVVWSEYGDNL